MRPICKKLIADVNIHVGGSQWYRLYRDRHGIGLMWNEVESIHRRILDMVFAIAIDSDVRVNTNRWHFSGAERELDAAIASNQYCLCQNADITHQFPQLTIFASLLLLSHLTDEIKVCCESRYTMCKRK